MKHINEKNYPNINDAADQCQSLAGFEALQKMRFEPFFLKENDKNQQ